MPGDCTGGLSVSEIVSDSICYRCRHFVDDPEVIERQLPGITALGSAYGSVRGNAGICRALDRFMEPLPGGDRCPSFAVKPPPSPG